MIKSSKRLPQTWTCSTIGRWICQTASLLISIHFRPINACNLGPSQHPVGRTKEHAGLSLQIKGQMLRYGPDVGTCTMSLTQRECFARPRWMLMPDADEASFDFPLSSHLLSAQKCLYTGPCTMPRKRSRSLSSPRRASPPFRYDNVHSLRHFLLLHSLFNQTL